MIINVAFNCYQPEYRVNIQKNRKKKGIRRIDKDNNEIFSNDFSFIFSHYKRVHEDKLL